MDDTTGQPKLSEIDEAFATSILSDQKEQSYQISRVVHNCPTVELKIQPKPVVEVESVVKVKMDNPLALKVFINR